MAFIVSGCAKRELYTKVNIHKGNPDIMTTYRKVIP